MRRISHNGKENVVVLSDDELKMILSVMNEFLLGSNVLDDHDWDEVMHHDRAQLEGLMDQFSALLP